MVYIHDIERFFFRQPFTRRKFGWMKMLVNHIGTGKFVSFDAEAWDEIKNMESYRGNTLMSFPLSVLLVSSALSFLTPWEEIVEHTEML